MHKYLQFYLLDVLTPLSLYNDLFFFFAIFKLKSILSDKTIVNLSFGASLIAQLVKNLHAMQETPVQFLGQSDLLQKG